jgi:hypothetical protein
MFAQYQSGTVNPRRSADRREWDRSEYSDDAGNHAGGSQCPFISKENTGDGQASLWSKLACCTADLHNFRACVTLATPLRSGLLRVSDEWTNMRRVVVAKSKVS